MAFVLFDAIFPLFALTISVNMRNKNIPGNGLRCESAWESCFSCFIVNRKECQTDYKIESGTSPERIISFVFPCWVFSHLTWCVCVLLNEKHFLGDEYERAINGIMCSKKCAHLRHNYRHGMHDKNLLHTKNWEKWLKKLMALSLSKWVLTYYAMETKVWLEHGGEK